MGSKKLKRKKVRDKKLVKLIKLYKIKGKKYKCFRGLKKVYQKSLQQNNINKSQLCREDKYSRSSLDDKYISDINLFAQMREHYFTYLQQIVCNNCIFCSSQLNENILENISLRLEQHALLASLQADIYEKSILEVINDIEKSTQEKQFNEKVKELLPEVTTEDLLQVKVEKSPSIQMTYEIPTITNTRPDDGTSINSQSNCINSYDYNSVAENFAYEYSHIYNQDQTSSFNSVENCMNLENYTNYWCSEISETSQNDFNNSGNLFESAFTSHRPSANIVIHTAEEKNVDSSQETPQQIQQPTSADVNPSSTEINLISEEKERAYIAHILEGEDSDDDAINNEDGFESLSENENDSKENVNDTNLLSRLERMKEIFGIEDDDENSISGKDKPKTSSKVLNQAYNNRNRRSSIWKHEKVIQLYKYSMLVSEMILEKQIRHKKLFLELFGDDSDDEHDFENRSEDKFMAASKERISPWVVKYLMPFYYEKKIIGRNTFKSLGHHISDFIINKILYPDEWSVKHFVSKFFPPKQTYFCDEDVVTFEYE